MLEIYFCTLQHASEVHLSLASVQFGPLLWQNDIFIGGWSPMPAANTITWWFFHYDLPLSESAMMARLMAERWGREKINQFASVSAL